MKNLNTNLIQSPEIIAAIIGGIAAISAGIVTELFKRFLEKKQREVQTVNGLNQQQEQFFNNKISILEKELFTVKQAISRLTQNQVGKDTQDHDLKTSISEINSTIDKIIDKTKNITRTFEIWKEAYLWLSKEKKQLVEQSLNAVLKKYPYLKNPGRALDSTAKKNNFRDSLDDRLDWILISLKNDTTIEPTVTIRQLMKPRISENKAYEEAFDYIKYKIKAANQKTELSEDATELMHGFLDYLLCKDDF
ncbi:MAG: hypothetical protein AB1861_13480 [Cyanobacteriota bacterium]